MKKINLSKLGIKVIRKFDEKEKIFISNYMAEKLREKYPYLKLSYLDIVVILYNTNMFWAKSPSNMSSVNYIYQNQSIYFSKNNNIYDIDEFTIHECIHRIQDRRSKKGRLMQLGNCEFTDTKIKGLFFNEAAIQYIVAKILERTNKNVISYGLNINTINDTYYPLITNLMEQLVILLGENQLIQSTICGDNDFNYQVIDALGVKELYIVRENFDKIQNLQDQNNINKIENIMKIKEIFYDTQKIIYENYFNKILGFIDCVSEVEATEKKLDLYSNFISSSEKFTFFKKFSDEKKIELEVLKRKIKAKQALVPVNKNFWDKVTFKFKNLFNYR